ncbi:hypothetical protein MMC24_007450 [Lignoscripta atroalba]|nr:hypothetical protein [Lignoscripta atroalba]
MSVPVQYTGSSGSSATFLTLPRELRDRVYKNVLEAEIQRPASPNESTSARLEFRVHPLIGGAILYERKPVDIACLGLLYCNRQISSETQEAIALKNKAHAEGVTYKLDCMVRYQHLTPTWLSLPAPPRYLQNIKVDVRMFSYSNSQFFGDGGPGSLTKNLLALLGGFFTYGPEFIGGKKLLHALYADMITINLASIDLGDESDSDDDGFGRDAPGHFKRMLSYLQCSGLLFGKVRAFRLCCDDILESEYEITDKGDTANLAEEWAYYGWIP